MLDVVGVVLEHLTGAPLWVALALTVVFGARPLWRWREASIVRADKQIAEDRVAKIKAERELAELVRKQKKRRGADKYS